MNFMDKLRKSYSLTGSCLCVGLDPNTGLIPDTIGGSDDSEKVSQFLRQVIDATADHCAAFKPNLGFFEALGSKGWKVFEEILDYIPDEKIVIADAKRGDISSTAEHYAKAFFEVYDVDAVTLNPLMGFETLAPFLGYPDKGIYVLVLTSNPGSSDLLSRPTEGFSTVAAYIANRLGKWQKSSKTDIGMVVGATRTKELEPVIREFPEASLLIPGIGKQGGSVEELREVLENHQGLPLVNSSRSIIYAGGDSPEWQKAVSQKAKEMKSKLSPLVQRYV